jgi:hypothetical protein
MLKQLSATVLTLAAVGLGACSMEGPTAEDLGSVEQAASTCDRTGLEWKPFLAHLAYDAAEDMGRWEFTTDLYVNGDRLAISSEGYNRCASRGRSGCPSMTAGLSAQEGSQDIYVNGKPIISPNQIRSMLVSGFWAQKNLEDGLGYITDDSEPEPYRTLRSASRTGLPHTLALTNCAVTAYEHGWYTGNSRCLRTGSLRMSDLISSGVGNDTISSVKVRSGMSLKLYEHDQFNGATKSFTADHPALWESTANFNDKASSLAVYDNSGSCSARDAYKVTVTNGVDWTKIRAKLVTLGYMRGNDVLDVRVDTANGTIEVDPYNVDFVPPSQIGGTTYGVSVKSPVAETWRSTDDPYPAVLPVNGPCKKKPYGSSSYYDGYVKASGMYRFCFLN